MYSNKENIYIDVLENGQGSERAVSKCQDEQQTFPRVCFL